MHSYHHRLVNFPYSEGDREACHVFFVWELLRPLLGGLKGAGEVAVPLYVIPDDHIYDPPKYVLYGGGFGHCSIVLREVKSEVKREVRGK